MSVPKHSTQPADGHLQKRAPKKEKKKWTLKNVRHYILHKSNLRQLQICDRQARPGFPVKQPSLTRNTWWIKARIFSDFWDSWPRFTRDAPKICKQLDPGIFSKKETMGHAFDWHLPALLSIYNRISVHT
jgi:hypothetical protein